MAFAASEYASASALLPASAAAPPYVDLSHLAPSALDATVRARAFRGELILFSFDFCGISEALALVLELRRVGFEHFAPMSDGPETCEALRGAASARGISPLWPCWYSSWPRDHPGWQQWGTAPGCVSAARNSHTCVLEQLWASRYHVAAQILATGVNLLHVDTDSTFLSDPYPLLKRPPIAQVSLLILPETPANGGMWYAQNTTRGTGAGWVIAEVARRTLRVIELALPKGKKGLPPFDQAMLGDVLFTVADGGRTHWGAACEHPHLVRSPLCQPANVTTGARRMRWSRRVRISPPSEAFGAALLPLAPPEWTVFPPARAVSSREQTAMLRTSEMVVAGESRREVVAAAPPWLFPSAWTAQQRGLYARAPPALSVVHLLGARCRWCESSEDVDHGAKWEWMHLSGFWAAQAYIAAPALNASLIARAIAGPSALSAADPLDPLAANVASEGGGVAAARTFAQHVEKHCHKRGRARLLYADRQVVSLASDAEELRRAEAADDGGALARTLIRRLVLLGALTGRMSVLPSFNCSSPWIKKRFAADGQQVLTDLRVVIVDVANGRPLHDHRCAVCNVQFACREHVLSEAQHAAARAMRQQSGAQDDAQTLHLPLRAPRSATTAAPSMASSPPRLAAGGAAPVVDLPRLWTRLLGPAPAARHVAAATVPSSTPQQLAELSELRLSSLADIEGDGCSIDARLLREARPVASRIAQLHCGIADTHRNLKADCPRSVGDVAVELSKWEGAATAARRAGLGGCLSARSPLANRLSARCYDLLCSAQSCFEHAIGACVARMEQEPSGGAGGANAGGGSAGGGRLAGNALRERCEAWVRQLPKDYGPQCDALTGECHAPPDAHAGAVLWPARACLERGGRAMCRAAESGARDDEGDATRCMPCIVRPRERPRTLLGKGRRP